MPVFCLGGKVQLTERMKAMVYTKYGSPDVLALKEVDKPTPQENEVLIQVKASSINEWDWSLLQGNLIINRLLYGLMKPKRQILGADVAGLVEAVGQNVKGFKPGDEVFGDLWDAWGGFAEYVCAPEAALSHKPADLTFAQAAAVPQAGLMALGSIQNAGGIKPGQQVLINGAGGGVGTFAVQLAREMGATVTGVDRTKKLALIRSLGAAQVIDHTRENFTRNGQRYDLIIDVAAHHSVFDYKRALSPQGNYVVVGGSLSRIFEVILLGPILSRPGRQKLKAYGHQPNTDLAFMIELIAAGKVVPVIDKCFPLSRVPEALRYFGEERHQGKLIITMDV